MTYKNTLRGFTQKDYSWGKGETLNLFPLGGMLSAQCRLHCPLVGEVRRSRGGGLSKSISSLEGGRSPDEGERKTKTSFINLIRYPLTCPIGHPLPQGRGGTTQGFTLIELLVVVLIVGILAAVREEGLSYSKFINGLTKANITLNRKMLSEMAIKDPASFKALVETAKKAA